jgi:hypothetical protein
MNRAAEDRAADVRRLLAAGRCVYDDRARIAPEIARSTGLTLEGALFGFSCLERDASDAELRSLIDAAGDAESVHVVLSANVFVAPLRAIAIARAASERVTVRPSPRDPTLARELQRAVDDKAIAIVTDRDVASVDRGEIHVYGRADTVAAVRARARPGVVVRGHGPGMGVALVTEGADVTAAAEAIASDIVPFDQRGCLSPRIVMVEGDVARGESLAAALHVRLEDWEAQVPRGSLTEAERAEAARWRETVRFVGRVWHGAGHVVGFVGSHSSTLVPPPGRHILVAALSSFDQVSAALAEVARHVVVVGSDDPERVRASTPAGARIVSLGRMQRPPLDGPVDRRSI